MRSAPQIKLSYGFLGRGPQCNVQFHRQRLAFRHNSVSGGAMSARIFEFVTAGEFDDVASKAMCQAFDAAAKELQNSGQPTIVLEVLAQRIVEAAKRGERRSGSPARYCSGRPSAAHPVVRVTDYREFQPRFPSGPCRGVG